MAFCHADFFWGVQNAQDLASDRSDRDAALISHHPGCRCRCRCRCGARPGRRSGGRSGFFGLGLAVVFGIINRHDGKLDIRSEEGRGTCFTITLPQYPSSIAQFADEEVQPVATRRVLVVDDEPEVITVVSEYLKMDGHDVQTARSGPEALECFSKGGFDLVITDRGMPEMNGDKMATAIKEIAPEIPVIMLSGFADVMKATADQPNAIDCIISKPISLNGLRKAMADVAE